MPRGSVPTEEIQKRALRAATKKPQTAAELADKMTKQANGKQKFVARGIGRALAESVRAGNLIKGAERKPTYRKP